MSARKSALNPLVVLGILVVIVAVDILSIQQLGTPTSTFTTVSHPSVATPAGQQKNVLVLPAGTGLASAEFTLADAAQGFAVPGSRVDLIGTATAKGKASAFVVLQNVLVVATDTDSRNPLGVTLSFALDTEQAKVLALAKRQKCGLSVVLRKPDEKPAAGYDIKKVAAFLEGVDVPTVAVAPPPRAK